jgi:hypothetical protein
MKNHEFLPNIEKNKIIKNHTAFQLKFLQKGT